MLEGSPGPSEQKTSRMNRLERKRSEARRHIATVAVVLGIIVAGAAVAVVFILLTTMGGGSKIPVVVGLTYDQARDRVESAGFSIEIDEAQDSSAPGIEKMKVAEQDPKPGTRAEKGEPVTVRLQGLSDAPLVEEDHGYPGTLPGDSTGDARASAPAPTEQPATQAAAPARSVCIDPGHSANSPSSEIDPATGLDVADNSGASGEIGAMWELALKLKSRLEQAGYTVRLTKESADSYASLRTRADIGNSCDIFMRLHYDPALQALLFPGEGQYKSHGGDTVMVDPSVARSSEALANAMFPFLEGVGIGRKMNDAGGTSNNTGPAYVCSVLSRVPVVLVENDPSMVSDNPSGQDRVADAITQGIVSYFQTH